MHYLFAVPLALLAVPALGQSLPSPTFNNATISGGTLTLGSGSSNIAISQSGTQKADDLQKQIDAQAATAKAAEVHTPEKGLDGK